MNCIQSFVEHAQKHPLQAALWTKKEGAACFGQIYNYVVETQKIANASNVQKGIMR